jgi:hypothetical protein
VHACIRLLNLKRFVWESTRKLQSLKEKMMKKQRLFHSKNSTPYWSVLAYDAEYKSALKPNNFMSLLQAQYKNAGRQKKENDPTPGIVPDAKAETSLQHL